MHSIEVNQAAEILHVNASTVLELIAAGELPAGRLGKGYVMIESQVYDYLAQVIARQTAERKERVSGKGMVVAKSTTVIEPVRKKRRSMPVLPQLLS